MSAQDDVELMQAVDGERPAGELDARLDRDPDGRAKAEAIGQLGEVVRGHLELAADDVPASRFDQMWRSVAKELERDVPASQRVREPARSGAWSRFMGWFERHRGHVFTGVVSAGVVAALALVLRPATHDDGHTQAQAQSDTIDVRPAAYREAPEIETLDTPDGTGTVLNLEDEDGHTAVIWVTPADTVEGI